MVRVVDGQQDDLLVPPRWLDYWRWLPTRSRIIFRSLGSFFWREDPGAEEEDEADTAYANILVETMRRTSGRSASSSSPGGGVGVRQASLVVHSSSWAKIMAKVQALCRSAHMRLP